MLKRLFLRESKEILKQVENAESILESAQKKMDALKSGDSFTLIKKELIELINEFGSSHRTCAFNSHMGLYFENHKEIEQQHKITQNIYECLNELERMINK